MHAASSVRELTLPDDDPEVAELVDRLLKQDLGLVLYTRRADASGALIALTPNVEEVTGFPAARILDDPAFWPDRIHPDDRERVGTDQEQLFETGHHQHEYRWRVANGTYRWFQDVCRLGTGPDGSARTIAGAISDVTEDRRRAEAHRLSEARYRAVVEDQTELICRFLPDGTLSFVNRAFCQYFGKRVDELLGRSFIPLLPASDREPMRRHLRWFTPERPIAVIEHQVPSASGEVRWQRRVDRAIFGPDDELVVFQSVAHDITELKRTEAVLRDSELRYRTLVEHAYDLICEIEASGVIRYSSPRLDAIVAGEGGRLANHNLFEHVRTEDLEAFSDMIARAGLGAASTGATARLAGWGDREVWVEWTCKAITAMDGAPHRVLVGRDITERKRAEEHQAELERAVRRAELLSAMGGLVGGVAHQVRNPLFAISSTLDAFEARFGREEAYERYLTVLREQVDRMTLLMQQLFEFGKPGGADLTRRELTPIVEDAVRSARERAEPRGVRIELDVRETLPVRLMPDRIAMVIENLVDNAAQHSAEGATVEVRVEPSEDGRALLCVVRDHGPGIPEDDLAAIFEPFFTRRNGGTGLGLAIVQRIVDAHGGSVSARNHPDGGAELTVALPVAEES